MVGGNVGETVSLSVVSDVEVVVPSFDGMEDLWPLLFHLFFKHWPDCRYRVTLGTNHQAFEHDRVRTVQVGDDRGYIANLRRLLESVDAPWVLFWIDDALLRRRVPSNRVEEIIARATELEPGFVLLYSAPWHTVSLIEPGPAQDLAWISTDSHYRGSLSIGLWRKDVLLSMTRNGETAWEFERASRGRSLETGTEFLSLSKRFRSDPLLDVSHGLLRGVWTREAQTLLCHEGLTEYMLGRPKQGLLEGFRFSACLTARRYIARLRGDRI